jgi:hypothetical protein
MGRHLRRTARRAGIAVAAVAAALAALDLLVEPLAVAAALPGALLGLTAVVVRVLAARDADAADERWLREVLDGLDPGDEELPPLPPPRPRGRGRRLAAAAAAVAAVVTGLSVLAPVAGALALFAAVFAASALLPRVLADRDAAVAGPLPAAYLTRP